MKAISIFISVVLALSLSLYISVLPAQTQSYKFTLAQAQEYALQNNKSLLNGRDKINSSNAKIKEAVSQGLPQVNGSLEYISYFNYELNLSLGSSSDELDIDYSVMDPGDYEVLGAIGQMFGESEPIVMSDQFTGKVQLTQLLFSGQYLAGVKLAKMAKEISAQSLTVSELDVKQNIADSYYNILITEQTIKILNKTLDNLNDVLKHTKNLYASGVAEETDVDQIQITVNQLKNTLKSLERVSRLNYSVLKFHLGVAPDAEVALTDNLDMLASIAVSQKVLTDFNVADNINYKLMESQVEIGKKQVELQNWAYGPTLSGFYSYTEKFLSTGFDMTPNNLIGVNLSIPIFSSGMRKAKVTQAKIDLSIAERTKEMVKDQLETQKNQLVMNYQNALENYETQKENIDVAERVYKSIQNKYEQGLASSLDLNQANGNFLNAQSNYFSSLLTLLQSKTALDKLCNKL